MVQQRVVMSVKLRLLNNLYGDLEVVTTNDKTTTKLGKNAEAKRSTCG
jgi:hypothetical protein